jgi:hypothetical protein
VLILARQSNGMIFGAARDPHRPVLFALAVLIHAGLFYLLVSQRHSASVESQEQQPPVLFFLEDTPEAQTAPVEVVLDVPERQPPRQIRSEPITSPAPSADESLVPPTIDWRSEAEQIGRARVLEAEARNGPVEADDTPKKKPEFRWSKSSGDRVKLEEGGVVVRLSERCVLVISVMLMPACAIGKIPVHGDLFEHMRDPPTLGDWKDE